MEQAQHGQHGSSLRDLRDLRPGDHTSLIHNSDEELLAVMVPYLRDGLEGNQRVFYIAEPATVEPILAELYGEYGVRVQTYIDSGQLRILSSRDVYVKDGRFDPEVTIRILREETVRARADGYRGLRLTSDMGWALHGVAGAERLLEYEVRLNEFFPGSDACSICQYDTRRFSTEMLLEVLQAHPTVIIGTQFSPNAYYMPPEELYSGAAEKYRLQRWLRNIEALKEERRSRERQEIELRGALEQKEQLLRELNHRVKNSLLMVSSLVSLKERTSPAAQDLTEVKTFVNTIQLIHEKLHQADNIEFIAFAPYVRELLSDIVTLFAGPPITLDLDIPDVTLPTSSAVNLGLILNELTTNTLKHGFEHTSRPRISVTLVRNDDSGEYVLTFSNNGLPLPDDFDSNGSASRGLGTRLVHSFVDKIGGTIQVDRAPHPVFTIGFVPK